MKLTISHPTQNDFECEISDKEFPDIKKHLQLYMEQRETDHCTFKLEGEAELKKEIILSALFG